MGVRLRGHMQATFIFFIWVVVVNMEIASATAVARSTLISQSIASKSNVAFLFYF